MKINQEPIEIRLYEDTYKINLTKSEYQNKRLAIVATDATDGSPFGKVTVNLPEAPLNDNEFFVKNWSDGAWVDQLLTSGLFIDTGKTESTGFCKAPVWKLKEN
jgi:hypothetical protein